MPKPECFSMSTWIPSITAGAGIEKPKLVAFR